MTELSPRLRKLTAALTADSLDALLILSPSGTCSLTGCHLLTQTVIPDRKAFVLITAEGDSSYLVCSVEVASAHHSSRIKDIHTYVEFQEEPAAAAARLLQAKGLARARIGIETRAMPNATYQKLQKTLPHANFVAWDDEFASLLMIKEEFEVEALETAGRLTQTAIERGLTQAAPSSSELAVANAILAGIMAAGIVPLFNVFAAGPNVMETHAEATNRIMQPGEIVRLDMGGRLATNHYLSDMARTAVIGSPSPEQADIYHKLYSIQSNIIAAVQPGRPISDLYRTCADSFAAHSLPFSMAHIGHGMGIGLHESPMIHPANHTLIEVGMVLNIEPHVAVADRHESYHIEDLVVVTENGCRLLTTPQPTLIQIPV
jgi:Xaa-Pro aminopeptidase